MALRMISSIFFAGAVLLPSVLAQSATTTSATAASTTFPTISGSGTTNGTATSTSSVGDQSAPPDVYLNVPQLSVGRIELDVDNLQADLNLAASVASLVSINAGVQVSVQKINLTIVDVDAELELIVRLGHLVDIVNRVFQSLDLNPLLLSVANATTSLLGDVVGEVDGLLGSITQGGNTLNFVVDNLGNIVQQVAGTAGSTTSSIVGNYLQNMTYTGQSTNVGNGLIQKVYSYAPLNSLVDIVFNTAGQVVQATVAKGSGGSSSSSTASSSAPTSTASTSSA